MRRDIKSHIEYVNEQNAIRRYEHAERRYRAALAAIAERDDREGYTPMTDRVAAAICAYEDGARIGEIMAGATAAEWEDFNLEAALVDAKGDMKAA